MVKKTESFEGLFKEIQKAVEDLEQNKLSVDNAMEKYQEAIKKIATARKIIDKMETKISEISVKQ
ncbi:exodeoxyribonuclease VII small subunit [bacterium]|jgi:exodeoxyribonuclease VII small subunit|nr:exodeoxyribonuclease VII small subunit [bacterium]MBT4251217.1 exodeoxyribonuclease VII small subunit [bacterium]MBT4597991.1 exodeoxyribonuclease VII small subunit [bacterium]MBT6753596.1 exodeoxyribonuclease VII small subunit [bacterium]MBT7037711.1 exodeoxyribonuclease VII small subunit [bacterium]